MKKIKTKGYTFYICTNLQLWAKIFYAMPKDAEIANQEDFEYDCLGFAEITEKKVWLYVPKRYKLSDLKETIAHEIGHIITGGFSKNPAERMVKLHEKKANHYMSFYIMVEEVSNKIECWLQTQL